MAYVGKPKNRKLGRGVRSLDLIFGEGEGSIYYLSPHASPFHSMGRKRKKSQSERDK